MGIGGTNSDVPEEVLREYCAYLREDTRTSSYFFKPVEQIEKIPDDVRYNQQWWERYCTDNSLDVKSGKRK